MRFVLCTRALAQKDYQSVLGVSAMDDDGPELILDLPEDEKEKDDLLSVRISRWIDGQLCSGRVADVCVGELSRERLYLVEYLDSDVEHLTEEEIREGLMLWATGEVEPFVDDGMEDEETIGYLSENEKEAGLCKTRFFGGTAVLGVFWPGSPYN